MRARHVRQIRLGIHLANDYLYYAHMSASGWKQDEWEEDRNAVVFHAARLSRLTQDTFFRTIKAGA